MIGRRVEAEAERVSPPFAVLLQKPSSSWEVVSEKAIPYARPSIPYRHHYPHLIHSGWCRSRGRAVKSSLYAFCTPPCTFSRRSSLCRAYQEQSPSPGPGAHWPIPYCERERARDRVSFPGISRVAHTDFLCPGLSMNDSVEIACVSNLLREIFSSGLERSELEKSM